MFAVGAPAAAVPPRSTKEHKGDRGVRLVDNAIGLDANVVLAAAAPSASDVAPLSPSRVYIMSSLAILTSLANDVAICESCA